MPRSTKEPSEKSRKPALLQEFEHSLPDFKNLDEGQHLKFLKAIRLLWRYFDISEGRLQRDDCFKLRSTIARLDELYEEYLEKDAVLASAISIIKLHIESHYLDDQDANLVRNLTGLHVYSPIPDCVPEKSEKEIAAMGASERRRETIGRVADRVLVLVDQAAADLGKVFLRTGEPLGRIWARRP